MSQEQLGEMEFNEGGGGGFRRESAIKSPDRTSPERTSSSKSPERTSPTRSPVRSSTSKSPERASTSRSPERTSASQQKTPTTENDTLNTEFIYYSAVLRTYAPILTREFDKVTTHLWMKKLFGPEYHSTVLKPKRNKYLLYLTITIYNNEAYGIFRQEPPCGVLPEIKDIPFDKDFPPAAWEAEKQWSDTVEDLPEDLKLSECYLHDSGCPQSSNNVRAVLDAAFQFYLWMSRPYVALLTDPEDKTMVACWIQHLCGIGTGENDCVELKELRNEYMQALLGYIHDLRVEGPFRLMPLFGPIPPLSYLYENCDVEKDLNNSSKKDAEEFLATQPLPDNGAFAYINVTGELFGNF